MPFDANGNYSLPPGYKAVTGTTIDVAQHNPPFEDVQAALNMALLRDGRVGWTGNQNANSNRLINLANGADRQDAVTVAQLDSYVPTMANDSDAVSGRVASLIYNKQLQQPVIFPAALIGEQYAGLAIPFSQAFGADGFNTFSNIVYREYDGALQANIGPLSDNILVHFPSQEQISQLVNGLQEQIDQRATSSVGVIPGNGVILGGTWNRMGGVLRQDFRVNAKFGDVIAFPLPFSSGTPTVILTAQAFAGQATTANLSGDPSVTAFTFISSYWDNNIENNSGNLILHVSAAGLG